MPFTYIRQAAAHSLVQHDADGAAIVKLEDQVVSYYKEIHTRHLRATGDIFYKFHI